MDIKKYWTDVELTWSVKGNEYQMFRSMNFAPNAS